MFGPMSGLMRVLGSRSGSRLDRFVVVGAVLAALLVVTSTIFAVAWYFHPVVYRDMWYMLDLLRTSPMEGSFWGMVWRPWSDHRIIFPKLLYALDFRIAAGTGALLVSLNVLCQAGVAVILGAAIWRQASLEPGDKRLFSAALWVSCFWLVQSGNLLWGFQIAWSLNALAVATAILLVIDLPSGSDWSRYTVLRGTGAILLVTVATFSLANGLLMWGVLGFLLWRNGAPRLLQGVWWICAGAAAWGALGATGDQAFSGLFTSRHVLFFLALLGSPFSRIHLEAGITLGAMGFAAFAAFAVSHLKSRGQGPFFIFAFAQITYVVLSALVITVGRGYKGLEDAISSRYYPPMLLFWGLLFCLAWLATRRMRGGAWIRGALAATALTVITLGQLASLPERAERSLKADLALLALAANVGDSRTLEYITLFPDSAHFWQEAGFLKSRNLSFYHDAPWLRTHGRLFADVYHVKAGKGVPAHFETQHLVTLPGRAGAFLQGRFDVNTLGQHPTGILAVRAGRVVGFAGTRRRGCAGCFSGFVSTPVPQKSEGELSLYAVYDEGGRRAYRLVGKEGADRL